jgi:hypothetical protein
MTVRRLLAAAAAMSCLLLAVAVSAVAAGSPPRLLRFDDTTKFQVKPATLAFGADGGMLVLGPGVTQSDFRARHDGHIRWTAWNQTNARGSGSVWINRCRPDCAAGNYVTYPVTLRASRVVNGRYTSLSLSYRRGNRPTVRRYTLMQFGTLYGWQ